jgi:Kef-type K+ transport system membrane component KefB
MAILLVGAAVAYGVARWLRQPPVPFLLAAGLALNFLGALPDRGLVEDAVQLGLAVLVFAAGIELSPARIGDQRSAAIRVGLAQFGILGLATFGVVWLLGLDVRQAIYLALAMAASSTLLVVRLLQQRKQMFEPFGRLVLGVLLLQDLLVILLLPVLVGLPEGVGAAARGLLGSAVLVLAAYVTVRWIAPFLILRLNLDEEGLLLVTLALLFVFIGAAVWLGLPMIAGAFLAGVSLSSFPVSGIVRGQLGSISDFFLAIFLTALGGLIGIPRAEDLLIAAVLSAMVILVTPPLVTMIAERAGQSARSSIEAGLLLSQTSEFSLVVILQGWALGHVTESILTITVVVTIVTMFLTPFLTSNRVVWGLMRFHPTRRQGTRSGTHSGHVLLIGCGETGMPLLETLLTSGRRVVVVDDDPVVVAALREGEVTTIRGDGSDFEVLDRAGARNAEIIISTIRRPRDSLHIIRRARGVPVLVRVFEDEDVERIRRHGGIPISYAEAASDDFLAWLEQATEYGLDRERRARPRTSSTGGGALTPGGVHLAGGGDAPPDR